MKRKKLYYLGLTEFELIWLHWALGEITSHPLWTKREIIGKRLIEKCWKLKKKGIKK